MSDANFFFRLRASGLPRDLEDEFTAVCFALGADGIAEDLKFFQQDLSYDPEVLLTEKMDLNIYFRSSSEQVLKLQSQFPAIQLDWVREENKDWLSEWKKGFVAFPFAGPFWVIPSWLEAPPEAPSDGRFQIRIEPGMAFGTGTHETTRLAARLLIRYMEGAPSARVLDVGTGTGILALIASRLGAREIVGLDIDPEAWRTARENLHLNGDEKVQILETQIQQNSDRFDIVVANIIDGVLLTLKADLLRAVQPGGALIVSGILLDRAEDFFREFLAGSSLKVVEQLQDGEWTAALLAAGAMQSADRG